MSLDPIFSLNKLVISAGDMSSDITSPSLDIAEVGGFAVHNIWTGSPTGNIIVQASNDDSNWFNVDTQAAGGSAGNDIVNIDGAHYRYVRVFYDATSGSGSLNSYISGKKI